MLSLTNQLSLLLLAKEYFESGEFDVHVVLELNPLDSFPVNIV